MLPASEYSTKALIEARHPFLLLNFEGVKISAQNATPKDSTRQLSKRILLQCQKMSRLHFRLGA